MKTRIVDGNLIASKLEQAEEKIRKEIPAGYLEVSLSTRGKVGAPSVVHIRNFRMGEVLSLSLTSEAELPRRLIEVLNGMIFEDTDVSEWHEQEILELMVYLYANFFKNELDVKYPYDEGDVQWLKDNGKEDLAEDLLSGKYKPVTQINILRDADVYELPSDFKSEVKITNKSTGFYCTFGFIKYGDQLIVKEALDSMFIEETTKFKDLVDKIQYNNNIIIKRSKDPMYDLPMIPIDPMLEQEYRDYVSKRAEVLTDIIRYVSILDYNGQDVSHMPLREKYELLSQDARIDVRMMSALDKKRENMKFGIKPIVRMTNPIRGEGGVVEKPLSFRATTFLTASVLSDIDGHDDYDID